MQPAPAKSPTQKTPRKKPGLRKRLHTRWRIIFWMHIFPKLQRINYWLIARAAMLGIWTLRRLPADRALNASASAARRFGPWFGRHRTALDNLRRAYPEKDEAEIEAIALGMWDNLGRLAAEYVFLEQLFDYKPDGSGRIEIVGIDNFLRMASETGKPHIIFTGHLGSFELLPIACTVHGTEVTTLFRPPNNPYIADYILSTRRSTMGDLLASNGGAAFSLAAVLGRGGNIGALVDQKFTDGVSTTFFGRMCESNPVVPMLARRFECDVIPARCVRLSGNRYRLEMEKPLELARNEDGDIDVHAATQQLNDVVERWVREHPEQWMWLHKRWSISGRLRGARKQAKRRQAVAPANETSGEAERASQR